MGAWSEDTFGSDEACDWAGDFMDNPSLQFVEETLDTVLAEHDYLEGDEGSGALAACEVIARLSGNWGVKNTYSEAIDEWVEANPTMIPAKLREKALKAIDRVLGDDSELPEMWEGSEEWFASVAGLRQRVEGTCESGPPIENE